MANGELVVKDKEIRIKRPQRLPFRFNGLDLTNCKVQFYKRLLPVYNRRQNRLGR